MFKAKKTLILLLSLWVFPLFLLNAWGYKSLKQHRKYGQSLCKLDKKLNNLYRLETENRRLLSQYEHVDSSYIHTSLESLKLSSSSNPIQFIEKINDFSPLYQEQKEKLARRVQVDFEDLKKILGHIELLEGQASRGHPHLIISDFTLKKNHALGDNFYFLDLELLKREY